MTPVLWAVLIGALVLEVAATRRIAAAKGLTVDTWTVFAVLGGPVALIAVVFVKPRYGYGEDRLSWWQRDEESRPWAVLAGVGLAATLGVTIYAAGQPDDYDGNSLEPQIQQWLSNHDAPGATVSCPDSYPGKAGYTFLCSASDNTGTVSVQVTVLNDKGEVNWLVLG